MRTLITVAICTRNRVGLLEKAVRSVLAQINDNAEILIVDNGSTDNTAKVAADLAAADARVKFFREPLTGLSIARNLALQQAAGDWVVFLDDDAVAEPGWLAAYENFFSRLPNAHVACAGGRVTPYYDAPPPAWLGPNTHHLTGPDERRPFTSKSSPFGCNYAVRRETALAVGGFNPALGRRDRFLGAHEETELAERLRCAGYEIWWLPDARIQHLVIVERLRLDWQMRYAFSDGRSRAIRRWDNAVGRGGCTMLVVGRVLVAPFHCGINLLLALVSFPLQNGRVAVRALIQAASIAGLTCGLLRQSFCCRGSARL
jgi:glycosyltransferase involved in cell wall biosynthesis